VLTGSRWWIAPVFVLTMSNSIDLMLTDPSYLVNYRDLLLEDTVGFRHRGLEPIVVRIVLNGASVADED
jgi:hypothetical protein